MSVAAAVTTWLANAGYGVIGTSAFMGGFRDAEDLPDAQITVSPYNGETIETYGRTVARPMVQVMVRADRDDYLVGERKADAMWKALCATANVTVATVLDDAGTNIGPVSWQTLTSQGTPFPTGWDDEKRPTFAMNFMVTQ